MTNSMFLTIKTVFIILCILCGSGCSDNKHATSIAETQQTNTPTVATNKTLSSHKVIWRTHAYLELMISNTSSQNVDDVSITFLDHSCTFGIVGSGFSAGYLDWIPPVSSDTLVSWRNSKQLQHNISIDISKIYNPLVEGRLFFTISETNAVAEFRDVIR